MERENKKLKLISGDYYKQYIMHVSIRKLLSIRRIKVKDISRDDFEYYFIGSSLYSSKIEGNTLDADSFFRNRKRVGFPKKKQVSEIEDLILAYKFAFKNKLTKTNFLKVHRLLSKTILPLKERGKITKHQMGIRDSVTLKPVYMAVEPEHVNAELGKLFYDIAELIKRKLSVRETFYYASMIHAWIAKIHPFTDGNGRSARLLEKWFLSSKLGTAAWSIRSEKYYWDHKEEYYTNIALGYNYYALHWERCIPFLLMLPKSVNPL